MCRGHLSRDNMNSSTKNTLPPRSGRAIAKHSRLFFALEEIGERLCVRAFLGQFGATAVN